MANSVPVLNDNGVKRSFDKTKNIKAQQGGTSAAYCIAKLKRDYPEIAERLCNGEFKNVAEAERTAKITDCFFDSQATLVCLIPLI